MSVELSDVALDRIVKVGKYDDYSAGTYMGGPMYSWWEVEYDVYCKGRFYSFSYQSGRDPSTDDKLGETLVKHAYDKLSAEDKLLDAVSALNDKWSGYSVK